MDISRIDYWATSGDSILHRAHLLPKLVATALVVASVVVSSEPDVLVALYAAVLISARAARLPVAKVLAISLFPGLFAVLFAVSHMEGGWTTPVLVIMKALTAASGMILLVATTPYTEVMGFFGRFLPRLVADGIFMTYRSFFILFEQLDHLLKALRLRGGIQAKRLAGNAGNMAAGIGMLFIRASDKSQRLYDVMSIRGYSGKLSTEKLEIDIGPLDLPYLIITALVFAYAIYERVTGYPPNPLALLAANLVYLACMEALRAWKR